ncbi:MAG: rRNA pseudouridine synthase [Lachnospiraceae bacterium]|nr:rRNA pseudouridine synthase [Lachnospiraceae bacterium]
MRLNKYLASCGICSRRDADKLIESGAVLVDGLPAQMGMLVDGSEEIYCNGKRVTGQEKKVVLLYNKPAGVTCTEKDSHAERTIATEVDYPIRVTYAGRLDKESKGLLLLTNDGDLIEEMMRGANGHEKEYAVRVNKPIAASDLKKLSDGIYLEDLDVTTKPCRTRKTGENTFRIILTQGLNRQIRRMCEAVGYRVVHLIRVRVVNLELGDLEEGKYREATPEEVAKLWEALRVKDPKEQKEKKNKNDNGPKGSAGRASKAGKRKGEGRAWKQKETEKRK